MSTRDLPLEILHEIINQISYDDLEKYWRDRYTRAILRTCTQVSRSLYSAARRRIWRDISIVYYPGYTLANKECDNLYTILRDNPALLSEVRSVILDISPDHPDPDYEEPQAQVEKRLTEGPAHTGLTKSLSLLASANVDKYMLKSELKIAGSDVGVDMTFLDKEVLFALTALRCSPTLKECYFQYVFNPPPAVVFGNPLTDSVEKASFYLGEFPNSKYVYHDFIVPRDSPSLDMTDYTYNSVVEAVANFKKPLPLFTGVKHLVLKPFNTFWQYLLTQPAPDSSKPYGGHLPSLEYISPSVINSGEEAPVYRALHANAKLRRLWIQNVGGMGSASPSFLH